MTRDYVTAAERTRLPAKESRIERIVWVMMCVMFVLLTVYEISEATNVY